MENGKGADQAKPVKYRLIVRPEAESDLQQAFNWYEKQEIGLGDRLLLSVERSIQSILRNPRMYQVIYKNVRRTLIRRFPYGVFYVLRSNSVVVLAIFHAMRDPHDWMRRLQ